MNLFIFHRDLRLIDNTSLIAQLKTLKGKIVPAFIFTPQQVDSKKNKYFSSNSVQFMVESLKDLNKQVQKYNGKMYYFYGKNLQVLNEIHQKTKINSIAFNLDYTPYAKQRDQQITQWAKQRDIKVIAKQDYCLYNLMQMDFMGKFNTAPTFTPFKFHCYDNYQVRKPDNFDKFVFEKNAQLQELKVTYDFEAKSKELYEENKNLAVRGGRQQALKILKRMKEFDNYFEDRNYPALPATKLSAYLHFTNVSLRQVYHSVVQNLGKNSHLIFELHCRQFFTYITHKFPHVLKQDKEKNLNPEFDAIKWTKNQVELQRWKQGTTGIPFVDAGMRQMNVTGYMHNRTRQNVASFLVKDLLIDWRQGQKYFAQKLVDYSATQNSGNWQYVAGVGVDPRQVRIFNPWLQAKKYDPKCQYIKRWIPQLKDVPHQDILNWQQTCQYHLEKGVKYFKPMVNHEGRIKQTQQVYRNILNQQKPQQKNQNKNYIKFEKKSETNQFYKNKFNEVKKKPLYKEKY